MPSTFVRSIAINYPKTRLGWPNIYDGSDVDSRSGGITISSRLNRGVPASKTVVFDMCDTRWLSRLSRVYHVALRIQLYLPCRI